MPSASLNAQFTSLTKSPTGSQLLASIPAGLAVCRNGEGTTQVHLCRRGGHGHAAWRWWAHSPGTVLDHMRRVGYRFFLVGLPKDTLGPFLVVHTLTLPMRPNPPMLHLPRYVLAASSQQLRQV
jgi:hypothetical protein